MTFSAKDSLVRQRQLKVQRLVLPFSVTGNATPASKVVVRDEPALLFLRVEGIDQISTASGALAAADTAPTLASSADSTGVFSLLVKIGEPVEKVCAAVIVKRNGQEVISCTLPSAPSNGIVDGGALDKIVLNADSAVNLSSADLDATLILDYIIAE